MEVVELPGGLGAVVDEPLLASMTQNWQAWDPMGTRAKRTPLFESRPTLWEVVAFARRATWSRASLATALAREASGELAGEALGDEPDDLVRAVLEAVPAHLLARDGVSTHAPARGATVLQLRFYQQLLFSAIIKVQNQKFVNRTSCANRHRTISVERETTGSTTSLQVRARISDH